MDDWKESLPEELRDAPSLRDIKDITNLAKSYVETKKMTGNSVRLPGEDSGPEVWENVASQFKKHGINMAPVPTDWDDEEQVKAFRSLVGVPEDPEQYGDAGLEDAESLEKMRKLSAGLGLTKKQHEGLVKALTEVAGESQAAEEARVAEEDAALTKAWGASKDDRLARLDKAGAAILGDDFDSTSRKDLLLLVDQLVEATKDTPQGHKIAQKETGPTTDELREQIKELRSKMANRHEYRPSHEERQADLQRLINMEKQLAKAAA